MWALEGGEEGRGEVGTYGDVVVEVLWSGGGGDGHCGGMADSEGGPFGLPGFGSLTVRAYTTEGESSDHDGRTL